MDEIVTTIPTIGFMVDQIKVSNLQLSVWDLGSRDRIRSLWRHYFEETQAIIYVIDSNDRGRFEESLDELRKLTQQKQLEDTVILILANKQDLPNAFTVSELLEIFTEFFGNITPTFKWHIQGIVALDCEGMIEGLNWLAENIALNEARKGVSKYLLRFGSWWRKKNGELREGESMIYNKLKQSKGENEENNNNLNEGTINNEVKSDDGTITQNEDKITTTTTTIEEVKNVNPEFAQPVTLPLPS